MPVQEHPVPQNITSYRFRLVGSMTLQQFSELAAGLGLGFILWKLPIYPILKMPLAIASAILGAMMAFVPIEDRPLDVWLTAFIKHIYKPTLFLYKPKPNPPLFSLYQAKPKSKLKTGFDKIKTVDPNLYLGSFSQTTPSKATVYVNNLFANEKITPRKESLRTKPKKPKVNKFALPVAPIRPKPKPLNQLKNQNMVKKTTKPVKPIAPKPKPIFFPTQKNKVKTTKPAQKPTFEPNLPKTKQKNTPVGMVVDNNDKPIVGAIVEVKNTKADIPLRVTKTNILGQFFFGNPLPTGDYYIETEHSGYTFTPIKISVKNQVIMPIKITGQKQV